MVIMNIEGIWKLTQQTNSGHGRWKQVPWIANTRKIKQKSLLFCWIW